MSCVGHLFEIEKMTFTLEQQQLLSTWLPILAFVVLAMLLILVLARLSKQEKRFQLHTIELATQLVKQTETQFLQQLSQLQEKQQLQLANSFEQQMADLRIKLLRQFNELQSQLNQNQNQSLDQLIKHLNATALSNREELAKTLAQSSDQMTKRIDALTDSTDKRLQEISGQVEKRLSEGFEKTTKTFSDILQRLALIDDAQKKITELSTNVVSLQAVLNDKRSRGAFGEVQLNS